MEPLLRPSLPLPLWPSGYNMIPDLMHVRAETLPYGRSVTFVTFRTHFYGFCGFAKMAKKEPK